jgi:hypothetical protein
VISQLKASARAALHEAMSEPASYAAPQSAGGAVTPTPEQIEAGLSLKVRWHNKMKIIGENTQADAGIIEGVNRLIFQQPNLDELGLTLAKHGVVTIPGFSKQLRLDYHEESDGPLNVYWSVVEL